MAEAAYFCPDCGSIDLVYEGEKALEFRESRIRCTFCEWRGQGSEAYTAVSKKPFWNSERLSEVLIRVIAKHGAGPMMQVFKWAGLVEEKDELGMDRIMQAAIGGCITAAFEAASMHAAEKQTEEGN